MWPQLWYSSLREEDALHLTVGHESLPPTAMTFPLYLQHLE